MTTNAADPIRFLTLDELREVARRTSFAPAGAGGASTMEMRPGDAQRSAARRAWAEHPMLGRTARLVRDETVEHEAPAESVRRFYPPERQSAWSETVTTRSRGAKAPGWSLLLIEVESSGGSGAFAEIWGVEDGRSELVYGRSLPLGTIGALAAGLDGAFAELERGEIAKAAGPAAPDPEGSGGPRL